MSREGRFAMKELIITQIVPNRKRHFEVYPIDQSVVDGLIESYKKTGDFGVIPVREISPGRYEQACGHHRLEAMKKMGYTRVTAKVAHFTDDEMREVMINENATQSGHNPASMTDSVLAVATDLAKEVFMHEKLVEISTSFRKALSHGANTFELVRTGLNKGKVSPSVICVCMGGDWTSNGHASKGASPLSRDQIISALNALKGEDGILSKEIFKQQDIAIKKKEAKAKKEIEDISKAKAKAKEAKRLSDEAEIARQLFEEEQERKRIEKEEHEAEQARLEQIAADEAQAESDRAEAEVKAKEEEAAAAKAESDEAAAKVAADTLARENKVKAKERKLADEETAKKEALIKKRDEQRKADKATRDQAEDDAEDDICLALGIGAKFDNNAQRDAFTAIVKKNLGHFPIEEQHDLVDTMIAKIEKEGEKQEKATAARVREYLNGIICDKDAIFAEEMERKNRDRERKDIHRKAFRIHDDIDRHFRDMNASLVEFQENFENKDFEEAFMGLSHSQYLYGNLEMLEQILPKLRKALGVASRSISKHTTVDNVIDFQ